MRWAANADLAAFHELDARGAGFDPQIAAAAQNGFRLALYDLNVHGSSDRDGIALDNAHGIGGRFIGARTCRREERNTKDSQAGCRKGSAAPARIRIGKGHHKVQLPATDAESLAYTIPGDSASAQRG